MPVLIGILIGTVGLNVLEAAVSSAPSPDGTPVNKTLLTIGVIAVGGFLLLKKTKVI